MEKKRGMCQYIGLLELYFTDILNSDYSIKFIFNFFFSSEWQPTEVKLHFGNNTDLNIT